MSKLEEAATAFEKIIKHGPGAGFRKAAELYWKAHQSDAGASEEDGRKFEEAIAKIPLDYRTPALRCLDDFSDCKEAGNDIAECYQSLAIQLADKIVHVI